MKLNKNNIKNHINSNLKQFEPYLSIRVDYLMNQLNLFQNHSDDEIDLFEVLVRLIFLADEGPANTIADLLIPINPENSHSLEKETLTNAASLIRDYLKRDYILYVLKDEL